MQELINLVINTIGTMKNSDSIQIVKESDNKFVFAGIGEDAEETQYVYKITVEYFPVEEDEVKSQADNVDKLKKQVELLTKEPKTKKGGK